jgi:hypothetical protein
VRRLGQETWLSGRIDRRDRDVFVHLIRSTSDPRRKKWSIGERDGKAEWLRQLNKTPAETWAVRILAHLADGRARTFNRIGVEMIDKTADVLFDTAFDHALWLLLERGELEATQRAPILFRVRRSRRAAEPAA